MDPVDFTDPNLADLADRMSQAELDGLPFGALKLDAEGRIVGYNAVEQRIAGIDFADATGQNFFTDIAPCMDNAYFRGRFEDGLKNGRLALDFEFDSDVDPRAENIRVRMLNASTPGAYWVFIKRL